MKSSAISRNAETISIWLWLFPCLALVFFVFMQNAYWALLIPMGLLFLITIIVIPESVPVFFALSNFIGIYVVQKSMMAITLTDAFFCLLLFAYISPYVFGGKPQTRSLEKSNVLSMYFVLVLISFFSVLVNVANFKDTQLVVSLWYFFKCCQLPLIMMIVSKTFYERKKVENIISMVILFSLLQLPVVLVQYFSSKGAPGSDAVMNRHVYGTFTPHHSMLGTFMLIPLSLVVGRFIEAKTRAKKQMYGIISLVFLYMIIISGSRSALLGVAVSVVVYFLMTFKLDRRYVAVMFFAIVIAIFLYYYSPLGAIVSSTLRSEETNTLDISSMSRLIIWRETLHGFLIASPVQKLVGIGMGAYNTIVYTMVLWNGSRNATGAHNNFLHVLVELGIVGIMIFITLFGVILKELHHRFSYAQPKIYFFCTLCLLVSGITQETFWFQASFGNLWLFYTFILSLIIQTYSYRKEEDA